MAADAIANGEDGGEAVVAEGAGDLTPAFGTNL